MVEIKGHLLEDKKLSMALSADGIINKVDITSTNHTVEFISQALKSAGTIASKFLVASLSVESPVTPTAEQVKNVPATCNLLAEEVGVYISLEAVDKDFYCELTHRERLVYTSMSNYLRTSFREYVTKKPAPECLQLSPGDLVKFDYKGHFLQAFSLYNEIVQLRHEQGTIAGTSGLVPNVTLEYFKLLVSRIEDPLQQDLNEFFGQQVRKTWNATYEVDTPDTLNGNEKQALLFAWSKSGGICSMTDTKVAFELIAHSVQPATPEFAPQTCSGVMKYLTVGVAKGVFDGDTGAQASDGIPESALSKSGMFYRVPAKAVVQVYSGTIESSATPLPVPKPERTQVTTLYSTRTPIAQIGRIVSLPESTGGRSTQYTVDFYADTGAIQNFVMTSTAVLDKSIISDVEAGTTSISDALATRKKAAHTDKELEELKRQHAILDEQVAIKKQQDLLNPPASPPPADKSP